MVERHEVEEGVDKPGDERQLAIQRLKMKRDFQGLVGSGLFAIIVTTVIWAMGGGGDYWPRWVILGVAIALVVQGWKAYGPSNRITEAHVQREMERG
ncbi:MAG TPA: 2TM domain-containing protein [Solirubrobacterales bacterium]|nr:2TM domain-containing protein [Solirubrobacterales bacterium]